MARPQRHAARLALRAGWLDCRRRLRDTQRLIRQRREHTALHTGRLDRPQRWRSRPVSPILSRSRNAFPFDRDLTPCRPAISTAAAGRAVRRAGQQAAVVRGRHERSVWVSQEGRSRARSRCVLPGRSSGPGRPRVPALSSARFAEGACEQVRAGWDARRGGGPGASSSRSRRAMPSTAAALHGGMGRTAAKRRSGIERHPARARVNCLDREGNGLFPLTCTSLVPSRLHRDWSYRYGPVLFNRRVYFSPRADGCHRWGPRT